MARKPTTKQTEKRIEEIREKLIEDMKTAGVNADAYGIALDITAQTLHERERAYKDYIEHGAEQVTEKGTNNPYAVRLSSWNSQARACLSMLKLTPVRYRPTEETTEE